MSWFPFVSRDRYDELRERNTKLEEENHRLTEMLIPGMRQTISQPIPISDATDLSKLKPIAGRPTITEVMQVANAEAKRRAETPGGKSLAEELAEHSNVWRRA